MRQTGHSRDTARAVVYLILLALAALVMMSGLNSAVRALQEPAGAGDAPEPPEAFVPSEEIRADSEVSFPVDI